MSRSRKKLPFSGITTAASEKEDKRRANRKERRLNRQTLCATADDTLLRNKRAVGNPWLFAKDGKNRFDPHAYPHLVRK
ncbi:MAG: hypothetical protein HY268_04735 [Deltaproteobacteria bacterium]|nr:hypothetical protein [Deltaproteobacteria bacterium]